MAYSFIYRLILFSLFSALIFTGCNQSSDQREFEREAFSEPKGFTQTDISGKVINDQVDPDDWRISPFFQGLVEVLYAHPNPVQTNEELRIIVSNFGIQSIIGLYTFVITNRSTGSQFRPLGAPRSGELPPGDTTISIIGLELADDQANPQGLYRIIITDANENVISYGDVQVE
ncbi:MAG: hypothetical protein WD008_03455 [Balneolaceae bacterium]